MNARVLGSMGRTKAWRWLLGALLICAIPVTARATPDVNCWLPIDDTPGSPEITAWPVARSIPVYVSVDSIEGVQTAGYDSAFVSRAAQIAIARWNEQSGITNRLKWAGVVSAAYDDLQYMIVISRGGCATKAAFAVPKVDGNGVIYKASVTLTKHPMLPGSNECDYSSLWATGLQQSPGRFVDMIVHELGHTMGRDDAYENGLGCEANACGSQHNTAMCWEQQDLSDFDRTEHQSVYGDRSASTALMRRMLQYPSTTWGAPVNEGTDIWDIAPGPGASYQFPEIPVTLVHIVSSITHIVVHNFNFFGQWTGDYAVTGAYAPRKPVSTSYAPDGTGVMAYVVEDGTTALSRKLCIRIKTSAGWSAENCAAAQCSMERNGVSTTYDPVSGRFLVAYQCSSVKTIGLIAMAKLGCTTTACGQRSSTYYPIEAAETPVVACANQDASENGNTILYSNCRLVYAKRDVAGQPIAWRTFGLKPGFGFPKPPPSFWVGGEHVMTSIESDHRPAVAWFVNQFYMAISVGGSEIEMYTQPPTQSTWFPRGVVNATGWVSPPFLSPTRYCTRACYHQLHLMWLSYTDPPLVP